MPTTKPAPARELTERDIAYALYLLKVHVPLGLLGRLVCRIRIHLQAHRDNPDQGEDVFQRVVRGWISGHA